MHPKALESLKTEPDYVQIYNACLILEKYQEDSQTRYINPDHDIIYLCFDVTPDQLSSDEREVLDVYGVSYNGDGQWTRYTSC